MKIKHKQKDYICCKRKILKKYINYFLALRHLAKRDIFLHSYPFLAFINPTTKCNYRCPFCARGNDTLGVGFMDMPLSLYKKVLDDIGDYLLQLHLFFYGEPFFNKDIFEMIRYAKKFYIYIRINTNFSIFSEDMARELVLSGLDRIIFSIDGISQKTYERYRVGGDFSNVLNNMKILVKMKKRLNCNKPRIGWQFLIFSHNLHEIEKARQICYSLGLDDFILMKGNTPDTKEGQEMRAPDHVLEKYGLKRISESKDRWNGELICQWTWGHLVVNADGKISPCCTYHENTDIFGDLSKKSFKEIWNGKTFITARQYFKTGQKSGHNILCFNCPLEYKCRLFIPFDYKSIYLKAIDRFAKKIFFKDLI